MTAPPDVIAGLDRSVGPRCLVTGGAGYVGRHLVDALLALGCEVRTLDRVALDRDGVDARIGDVRDRAAVRDACEGVDTVFHTAAVLTLLGIARRDVRERVMSINVGGTDAVIEGCRAAGVGRLVYTSSANVAIDRELVDVDESVGYARTFVDLYGESKVLAERAVLAADGAGLRTAAIRPGGIWGPGSGGYMIETFLAQLAAGRLVATIGDGRAVVDNTHVFNVVRAMLLAAAKLGTHPETAGGQAYFVTDDERINGIEWFRPIVEGLGRTFPARRLPGRAMLAVGWASELAHYLGAPEPALTRIGVLKLIRSSAFSIDKARRELGYAPLVRRDDGVAMHLDDYREALSRLEGGEPASGGASNKRVFLVWDRAARSRAARRSLLLDEVAPALLRAGADRLSVLVADDDADLPSPSPFPQRGPDPIALVNAWVADDDAASSVARALRGFGLDVAGYLVDESVYTDYGENRHAAPRDWPDGARSPGVVTVSLLHRPKRLSRREWIARWHGTMSPVSERIQPRARYVRNLVLRPITDGAPPYDGIVEEAWPSAAHLTTPMLFYGADGPVALARNMLAIGRAVSGFLDIWRVRTFATSEYFVATEGGEAIRTRAS